MRVWMGSAGFALADYGQIFDGTAQGLAWNDKEITVNLRTLEYLFDKEFQTINFTGGGGVEGGTDLTSKPKPRGYGINRGVEPIYLGVISGKHSFAIGDGAITHVEGVWDQGVPLTFTNAVPVAGEYTYNLGTGIITLGGSFVGPIVATFVGKPVQAPPITATNSVTIGTGNKVFTIPAGQNLRVGMRVHVHQNIVN